MQISTSEMDLVLGSEDICGIIGDYLCDGEPASMRETCKTMSASFSKCPLRLVTRSPHSVREEDRATIVSCVHEIRRFCKGLSVAPHLRLMIPDIDRQLRELSDQGREQLKSLSIRTYFDDTSITVPQYEVIRDCRNLTSLSLESHVAMGTFAKHCNLFETMFESGIRLTSLKLSGANSTLNRHFPLHLDKLESLSLYGGTRIETAGGAPVLQKLSVSAQPVDFLTNLISHPECLKDLRISTYLGQGGGEIDYFSGRELKLRHLDFCHTGTHHDWDVSKWSISESVNISAHPWLLLDITRNCSPLLKSYSVYTGGDELGPPSIDLVDACSRFRYLECVFSNSNHVIGIFSGDDGTYDSVTTVGILSADQLRTVNLPAKARHLIIKGCIKVDPSKLPHRRFWDSVTNEGIFTDLADMAKNQFFLPL